MRSRRALTAFCCTLALAAGAPEAKDQTGAFAVKGVGALQCSTFVAAAAANTPRMLQYAGYATGYVSAFNELAPSTFDALPWQNMDTLILLTLQRCKQAPEIMFGAAVSEVTRYFGRDALAQASAKVRLTVDGRTVELYRPVVEQIEQALVSWGYPDGDITASLKRFKEANNIAGEHPFDQLVLLKLLYGKRDVAPKE